MNFFISVLLWCFLFILCWPLAIILILLYPLIWILALPFRLLGLALNFSFSVVEAILMFPFRMMRKL